MNIQDITAGHIFDYVNYLSNNGGRKDNKIGGQSNTSIRKIISILKQVFEYAVLYGDIKINPALQVPLPKSKKFRKQLIDAVIKYSYDLTSLITAAVLIKRKFTIGEIANNYYASVDLFGGSWF